ncbi:efflux RND transporter periplasmic adaptor subunit [Prevotella sp. HCN-7019]|uniref:efflux RND transporter periplasmic adaptor subunit n=1 Tax=Prevotella sp. HCN-7019 TaxID=3134668 RepID=UPI0030C1A259
MKIRTSVYLAFLFLSLVYGCSDKKQTMPGEKYKMMIVSKGDYTLQSAYTATLRGRQAVEVRPQVSGTITEIRINEGDNVRRGQILFVIDQVPYKAALATARANMKSAEAKLQTAKLTADSKNELYREKVVSDFDRQTALNQLREAEAAVAQAKAEVTRAANDLSYTEVKSPVDGVASMIPYRVGALVSSTMEEPLVTVSDDSEIYAYFSMAESQMIDLIQQYGSLEEAKKKMPAVGLTMSNGRTYDEQGCIDAIGGTVDDGTGAVTLRAVFKNPRHLLRNGGSASVVVPTVQKNCISIPRSATYELQNRVFTWKVVDGKTQSTPITIYKYNDGQNYIVLSGLNEGDIIISEGAGLMREGTAVNMDDIKKTKK